MLADGGVPKHCHLHSPIYPYSLPFILLGTAPSDTAGVAGGLGSSLALLRSDTWRQQAKGKCHSVTLMRLGGRQPACPHPGHGSPGGIQAAEGSWSKGRDKSQLWGRNIRRAFGDSLYLESGTNPPSQRAPWQTADLRAFLIHTPCPKHQTAPGRCTCPTPVSFLMPCTFAP